MNNLNKDIFHIIFLYLNPLELTKIKKLNKYINNVSNNYIKKILETHKKNNLIDLVCPKCGSWTEDIYLEKFYGFKDLLGYLMNEEEEKEERYEVLKSWFSSILVDSYKRKKLLCDDCEYYEESPDEYPIFKYSGHKDYKIVVIYSSRHNKKWSFISFVNEKNIAYWNDYLKSHYNNDITEYEYDSDTNEYYNRNINEYYSDTNEYI
jgi:hypothetical protein